MGFYISSTPPGQVSDTIFSLFLLPFLKQPLKREDGTEAKAEKNVMPMRGRACVCVCVLFLRKIHGDSFYIVEMSLWI